MVDLTVSLADALEEVVVDVEREYLVAALELNCGQILKTAATAGISRRTLLR